MIKLIFLILFSPTFALAYVPNAVNSSGSKERVERALITNNGTTCAVSTQTGSWVASVSRTATGTCQVNFTSGIFSSTPTCVCVSYQPSQFNTCLISNSVTPSATTMVFATGNASNSSVDNTFSLICMGTR